MNVIPLILTLKMDDTTTLFFNELRKTHFPPAINYLDAHLTLFHHLKDEPVVIALIEKEAQVINPFSFQITGLMKLGRGVAFQIQSPETIILHKTLQVSWLNDLTPQDRQPLKPHVTIQNKVDPVVANTLFDSLSQSFVPFQGMATGLVVWEYRGGPWIKRKDIMFPL